ncbi:MAG: histidine kinase [Lapillicoccus sp.]
MRTMRVTAVLLFSGAVVMVGAVAALLVRSDVPGADRAWAFAGLGGLGLATTALGVVISWRVPGNVVGFLVATFGTLTVFLAGRDVYYAIWRADHAAVPLSLWVVALLDESGWWLLITGGLMLLVFPGGHVPGPRWRVLPWLLAGFGLVQQAYGAVAVEPLGAGMEDQPRPWGSSSRLLYDIDVVVVVGAVLGILACGVALVLRFRRSSGRERAQLKWLSAAGLIATSYPLTCVVQVLFVGQPGRVSDLVGAAALASLPVAVALAMLRHDLFDVDRVIADTISYGAVLIALVAAYASSAVVFGLLVGRDSPLAASGATAVCALLLLPLRRHLKRAVDDRLFPPRQAAFQAVEDLGRRIDTQEAAPEELEQVLRAALRDPGLRLGIVTPDGSGYLDAAGAPVEPADAIPVRRGGVTIGVLLASDHVPAAVLRPVAEAAASLVDMARLRAQLSAAVREVEASRTRLVLAGDAERRHLERDLHDGAQQRLVALGMSLRVAQHHLDEKPDLDALLERAVAELATAVAELRQIAHGLRPTSLDDGLHAALADLSQRMPIPVRLAVDRRELSDEVATTAYYVAAEAMTNAAKHADATSIDVQVERAEQTVRVRVRDDGRGGARANAGFGLTGLADRVAAIGGTFGLQSPLGRGTTIEAVLPCES